MEKVRIGIIGCGGAGRGHVRRLIDIPAVEVVGCADSDPQKAENLAVEIEERQRSRVPSFTDYRQMLDNLELDAVGVFTPHTLHFEQALAALEKGLHVLVEKPMVCSSVHAKRLVKMAEEKKRILLVSYQRHYQPIYRYAKDLIRRGELGQIKFLSSTFAQDWMRLSEGTWRREPKLSGGGQLMDSGSHILDTILWLTDLSIDRVCAFTDNQGTKVDIFSVLSIRFKNGALGNISISGDAPAWYEDLLIWGSKGALFFREGRVYHQRENGDTIQPGKLPQASNPDQNFVDAILGKEEVHSPGICGLRVAQLTEAAYQSAKSGNAVKL